MPLINPARSASEPEINGPCLLIINPDEFRSAAAWARQRGATSHRLYNGELLELSEELGGWLAGPAVGAPMATMSLEKLIALGAKRFIVYGWCGALRPDYGIGDLLMGSWGISEEGTSSHYPLATEPEPSPQLCAWLDERLKALGLKARSEKIWTTDAPYRETRAKIEEYAQAGIAAVEMEFSALLTVAAFRRVEIAGLFMVSDELYHEKWQPGFRAKSFQKKSRRLIRQLAAEMVEL
ncbi:MAG: nucleoside phosphorylase [Thermodesulfobacteriota bacterium]